MNKNYMSIPSQLGIIPKSPEEAYLSFPAAVETGILQPELLPSLTPQEASLLIRSGVMPPQAGIVRLPGGVGAFDLVAVDEASSSKIILPPTTKDAVDNEDGAITAPGLIVLSNSEGRLRPYAYTISSVKAEWMKIRNSREPVSRRRVCENIGSIAIVLLSFGEVKDFEIQEIESDGTLIAKSSTKFF